MQSKIKLLALIGCYLIITTAQAQYSFSGYKFPGYKENTLKLHRTSVLNSDFFNFKSQYQYVANPFLDSDPEVSSENSNLVMSEGSLALQAGFSLGSILYGGIPLFIGGDYMVTDEISIGAEFVRINYRDRFFGTDIRYKGASFGVRVAYHFMHLLDLPDENIDLYGGIFLGYIGWNYEYDSPITGFDEFGSITYNFFAGARYMFIERLGGFGEFGYGITLLKLGLTVKVL